MLDTTDVIAILSGAIVLVYITVGVSIIEMLDFDPIKDITAGIQPLNAVTSDTIGTNIIMLIILN